MSTLNFETGLKSFDINGDPEKVVHFCPTDFNFISRLFEAFSALENRQTDYQAKITAEDATPEKALEVIAEADKDVRTIIDRAFEAPVSDIAFGNLSSLAIAGGLPLWAGFLVAVMMECDENFVTQKTTVNPKLEKLIGKYRK